MSHKSTRRADARLFLPFAVFLGGCSLFESDSRPAKTTDQPGAAPALAELSVTSTRTSPALVKFVLSDADDDAADVSFDVRRADGTSAPATFVKGDFTHPETNLPAQVGARVTGLQANASGSTHYRLWDFATDLGTDVQDVTLQASLTSDTPFTGQPTVPDELEVLIGNEPPVFQVLADDVDASEGGILRLPMRVRDSRGDSVRIRVEYQIVDSAACADFFPARDALLPSADETPDFQLLTTVPSQDGTFRALEFLWDTEYVGASIPTSCDLFDDASSVRLRFIAEELLTDPDDQPLSSEVLAFEDGLFIDNRAPDEPTTDPEDETDAPGDDDGDGDEPGGDDGGDDDDPIDPWASWIRQLLANHPWVAPFLEDPELREIILIGSRFSPTSFAVADLDNDQNLDIVWADTATDTLKIYLQTARGVIAAEPIVLGGPEVTAGPVSVTIARLDADRSLDIVAGNLDGDNLTIFFQTDAREFSAPTTLEAPSTLRPMRLRAVDFDRDGDNDLTTFDEFGEQTALFMQVRPGLFRFVEPGQ